MPFNIRTPQDSDVEPIVPEKVRFVCALLTQNITRYNYIYSIPKIVRITHTLGT